MSDVTEEILETIERFLGGNMEAAERLQFEEKVNQDTSLKSLVDASKSVQELLVDHKTIAFKAKFSSLLQEEKAKKKWRYTGLGIAVGFSLIGIWAHQLTQEQNAETAKREQTEFTKIPSIDSTKTYTKTSNAENPLTIASGQNTKAHAPINISKDTAIQAASIVTHQEVIITHEQQREAIKKTAEKPVSSNNTSQGFDCSSTMITFTPQSTATCKGQSEGSISISENIEGGKAPYHWHIDGIQKSPRETIEHLSAGDYWVVITDQNSCSSKTMVTITTKNCIDTHEYSLDPYDGNKLNFGLAEHDVLILSIHQKNGKLVYKQRFESGDTLEWEGKDMEGNVLSNGVYLYSIMKGTELKEKGYVTIVNLH